MMKITLIAAMTLAFSSSAWAQSAPALAAAAPAEKVVDVTSAEFQKKVSETEANAPLLVTRETVGANLSPEERKRLETVASQITDKSLQRYHSDEAKQYEAETLKLKRRVDDIADEALAGNREKVLKFLGVDPKGNGAVYYFVSFSMPQEMLRSYVLEAMWSGGTIVVRGVPKGRTIKEFFGEDLRQLIYGKGASANISMDPRLFEVYDIQAVPAIVYSEDRNQPQCTGQSTKKLEGASVPLSYDTCQPQDPSKYWKMSGAVTTDFALRAFVEKGATGAQAFHNALRKGVAPGAVVPKEQEAFSGAWKDAISPEEIMAGKQAIEAARLKQESDAAAAAKPQFGNKRNRNRIK
jgi:type-F conjugative transfer system pilin assembly protein TrbC